MPELGADIFAFTVWMKEGNMGVSRLVVIIMPTALKVGKSSLQRLIALPSSVQPAFL